MSLEIDWSSAEVHGGDVTLDLAGKVSKQSRERFEVVRSLLGETAGGWDEVKLVKRTIHVRGLRPEAEHELRHFLDSVIVTRRYWPRGQAASKIERARDTSAGGRRAWRRRRTAVTTSTGW